MTTRPSLFYAYMYIKMAADTLFRLKNLAIRIIWFNFAAQITRKMTLCDTAHISTMNCGMEMSMMMVMCMCSRGNRV